MVVKELVALLGVKTDKGSFKKADKKLDGLASVAKKAALAIGGFFAVAKIARGIASAVKLASSVNETLNVLEVSFGDSSDTVIAWADAFSAAAGRSTYDMREIATKFGAVLNPMLEGNTEAAADMSMGLAQLTVDLASFYEAAESDVLLALRSGLTSGPEAMQKFGVVMKDATLKTYALEQGIKKDIKAMSNAEQTQLKYNYIVSQTKTSVGDAAKTVLGFANASKALQARLKDLSIRFGMHLIPPLEESLKLLADGTPALNELADTAGRAMGGIITFGTHIAQWVGAMSPLKKGILGVIVVIGLLGVALTSGPIGRLLALTALLGLIAEDFVVWQEGGDSAIGAVMDKWGDYVGYTENNPLDYEQWISDIRLFAEGASNIFGGLFNGVVWGFMNMFEVASDLYNKEEDALKDHQVRTFVIWQRTFTEIQKGFDLLGIDYDVSLKNLLEIQQEIGAQMSAFWRDEVIGAIKQDFVDALNWIKNALPDWFVQRDSKTGAKKIGMGAGAGAGGGGIVPPTVSPSGGGGGGGSVQNNVNVEVHATPGMSEEKLAFEVGQEMSRWGDKQNRTAMRTLTSGAD